ncbi:MAG: acetamidase, partial [Negativicoccus succinicivorans]|nr:acetamidase [Negativicoccus succinicivorans]
VNTCGPTCDDAIRAGDLELHRLISDAYDLDYTDTAMYMSIQGYLCANQACLVEEAGGDSFRVGTPKVLNKKPLIG